MSNFTTLGKNKSLNGLNPTTMTIHSGNPGATGSDNQIGDPQNCTFGSASNGERNLTNTPEFNVSAGTTVAWLVVWDNDGDAIAIDPLANPETYSNNGIHRISSAKLEAN